MTHDLKTEEVRPVQSKDGKSPATLYAWCVCGGWAREFATFHRGPVLDAFFDHLRFEVARVTSPGFVLE